MAATSRNTMATIDICRDHTLAIDVAKTRATQMADDLKTRLGITYRWEGDNIRFSADSGMAKGVTGIVSVGASSVRVEIDLPFLLRAMKSTIVGKVNKQLDAVVREA
jgi:putative polyhydroxyalkanoate system protein